MVRLSTISCSKQRLEHDDVIRCGMMVIRFLHISANESAEQSGQAVGPYQLGPKLAVAAWE